MFSTISTNDGSNNNNETNNQNDEKGAYTKRYHLTGETTRGNKSGVTVSTKNSTGHHQHHTLQTDLPKRMGGQDTAAQPVELLLTAWMGCTQATALFVGRQMMMTTGSNNNNHSENKSKAQPQQQRRFLLDRLVFDVQGERDERGALSLPIDQNPPVPSRLQRVSGTITVYRAGGLAIAPEEMKLLQEQTELRCPVANMMIASGCQMDVKWIDGASIKNLKDEQ